MLSTSVIISLILAVTQANGLKLRPCPDSPNCVNTYQEDEEHSPMGTLKFQGSAEEAIASLMAIISEMPRTTLVSSDSNYVHYEFKIAVFGFIDDVEFQVLDNEIHFRSASRKGYYDLGVNRSRMKDIQTAWKEKTDNKKPASK